MTFMKTTLAGLALTGATYGQYNNGTNSTSGVTVAEITGDSFLSPLNGTGTYAAF